MKRILFLFLSVFLVSAFQSKSQETLLISGRIHDSVNATTLAGAYVRIKGSNTGVVTNKDGVFTLKTAQKIPFTLTISFVGYKTQEFNITNTTSPLSISLNAENSYVNEVVVTASRVSESILKSPVTIEKLGLLNNLLHQHFLMP